MLPDCSRKSTGRSMGLRWVVKAGHCSQQQAEPPVLLLLMPQASFALLFNAASQKPAYFWEATLRLYTIVVPSKTSF